MQDHVSRLVGLDGFRVKCVIEDGDQLDLEVELVTRAESCPHCSGTELEVHERPVVAVRDLPLAGRRATLRWRKRRYRCKECRRTHTETCREVSPRQRLTGRFRDRLAERVRSGGAHTEIAREERTTRYQVTRARRCPAGSPSMRPPTARAPTTWRQSSQTSIADASTRSLMGAPSVSWSAIWAP
jgi:transposase